MVLNDPIVLESSRVFAERLVKANTNATNNIKIAFQSIVCRTPADKEMSILQKYYDEELKLFTDSPEKAKQLIHVGEYPIQDGNDPVSVAALMQVIHTIYNMDESITKV